MVAAGLSMGVSSMVGIGDKLGLGEIDADSPGEGEGFSKLTRGEGMGAGGGSIFCAGMFGELLLVAVTVTLTLTGVSLNCVTMNFGLDLSFWIVSLIAIAPPMKKPMTAQKINAK